MEVTDHQVSLLVSYLSGGIISQEASRLKHPNRDGSTSGTTVNTCRTGNDGRT